jgi:uncharacterized protein (TIGR03435 family)
MSDLQRISRRIYGAVIQMHPAEFRDEFGREMALDFEDALRERGFAPLLGDACVSVARQWRAHLVVGHEVEQPVASHPFLAGQYCMIRQGSSLSAFDLMRASLISMLLFLTVGFAANLPNRHAVGEPQSVQVSHGGADDEVTHATRATVDKAGRVRSNEWDPKSSGNGSGILHPTGPIRLGPPRLGFSLRRETPGGPPRGTLREVVWQLTLISVIVWLAGFFLYRSRGIGKRVGLGLLGLLGIAASVAFGAVPVPAIHAQLLQASAPPQVAPQTRLVPAALVQEKAAPPAQDSPTPIESYSVVSVKASAAGVNQGGQAHIGDTSIEARNMPLKYFIKAAYGLQNAQILGGPAWMDSQLFDVVAKSDLTLAADKKDWTPAQRKGFELRGMVPLQNLLADRFALKVHFEDREAAVYALVIAKSGSKLQPPGAIKDFGATYSGIRFIGPGLLVAIQSTTGQLSRFLNSFYSSQLGRLVVDDTGLTGTYDFRLQWTPDLQASTDTADSPGPSLFTAIQEQLGLKLEPQKAPVRTLIIDHVEPPSAN